MKKRTQDTGIENADPAFWNLYKTGAVAAIAAAVFFRRNLDAEWMLLRGMGLFNSGPTTAPGTVSDWFALFQQSPLLGLTLMNGFDLVNYALVAVILLALAAALKKTAPSAMTGAAALVLVGVTAYFASNQAFAMLSLSQQYATASSETQRAAFLAAGQAVLAIHQNVSYLGPGIYLSFLLVSAAGLMISITMLRSSIFGRGAAYVGILANGFQLSYYLVRLLAPAFIAIPISISAVFLLVWYLQVGIRLWQLGADRTGEAKRSERYTAPAA